MPSLYSLFDTFSANLALYTGNCAGGFMCPLCLRPFSRDGIQSKDLTRAHIIPQFLGGRHWTLACKECNNRVGSRIESCEAERANFNWALAGDGKETTRVRLTAYSETGQVVGPVQAELSGGRPPALDSLRLGPQPKGSNPAAFKLISRLLLGGPAARGWKIDVKFRETRSRKRANLVYVHAAYLFMFNRFGYEWALDPCTTPIRAQIASPDEAIIAPLAPALAGHGVPDDEMAVFLVTRPADWHHFLVLLPLFRGWPRRQGVWMPLFGRPYEQPPQLSDVDLQVVRVPELHSSLDKSSSLNQGRRFVAEHLGEDRWQ